MNDLEKQAKELGIKVDGRWSEERLQEEIDKALAAPAKAPKEEPKPEPKFFPVKLEKNYRPISPDFTILDDEGDYREPTDEERFKVTAGRSIKIPVEEAQSVIEKGIAKRNDPIR
ncbi:hypothetical protein HJB79_31350 [Rhizobium lentis]|uniref:hypothetical protein n=1 Tax=Rhizobium lentis TaxID=1138194 RepID=UPI001C83F3C0|nr:hypothetical protein [Rhizobium lentis]MBX5143206.1 hypothetical protein [Rhizobium lentis]